LKKILPPPEKKKEGWGNGEKKEGTRKRDALRSRERGREF